MIFDANAHWDCRVYQADAAGVARWLAGWNDHQITHGVVMPLLGLFDHRRIQEDNEAVAAACARSGGRMIPFSSVHPNSNSDAISELLRCLVGSKCRGLKIHGWLQGASPSTAVVDQLCEIAAQYRVPVLFHDGTPCFAIPSQMALLARRHPKTTMILGHCGLFEHWREAVAALRHAENLWGCLCGPHAAALREIIRRSDGDRLLWGSDFGFGAAEHITYRLGLMRLDVCSQDRLDAILSRNPARLFGLT